MNYKSSLISLGLLVLLGTACSFNISGNANSGANANEAANASDGSAREASSPRQATAVVPEVTKKAIDETLSEKKIIVSAEYPQISGVETAEIFNQIVEREVKKRINAFKKEMEDPLPEEMDRGIDIRYEIALADAEIVSVLFWDSENTGGAHPNTSSFVLNYDLKAGREIALNELFAAGSQYLKKFSDYCRPRLKKKLDDVDAGDDWLKEGSAPTKENYRSWVITEEGIKIVFDAYQVAAYAYGPQEVVVPYSVLSEMLEAKTPVEHLAGRRE